MILKFEIIVQENNLINESDIEEREWLLSIMTPKNIYLHNNKIGDGIGDTVLSVKCEILNDYTSNSQQ